MSTFLGLLAIIIVIMFGVWVYDNHIKQEWMGIAESRTSNDVLSVPFSSRDACADWLYENRGASSGYKNHECGRNCEQQTSGLFVCKETF